MTPTALTMRHLRRAGYLVDVAERWIPRANIRRDLFGIIDLVAITIDEPVLGIQATSISNVSTRLAKARQCPALGVWLRTGARFQVIGWAKVRGHWHPKIIELTGADMAATVLSRPPRRRRSRKHEPADLFATVEDGTPT